MPQLYALDSFAVIAYFENERGAEQFLRLIERAEEDEVMLSIAAVNLGEVLYLLTRRQGEYGASVALGMIRQWPIRVVDVDEPLALLAANIKAQSRMGYLDCFVVALAQRLGATVVTGDPDFRRVEDLVPIEWLER